VGDTGLEGPEKSPGKTAVPTEGGAKSGAANAGRVTVSECPEIATIMQRWPSLSATLRTMILDLVCSEGAEKVADVSNEAQLDDTPA
jgi:hypothetical protein